MGWTGPSQSVFFVSVERKMKGRKKNIPLKIQSIVVGLCFSSVSKTAANYFLLYKNAESLTVSFFPAERQREN